MSPKAQGSRLRRALRNVGKLLLVLAILLVAALLMGAVYQSIMNGRDARRYPPPGRIYQVDGRDMHLNCTGDPNGPVVILESGLTGGWSLGWVVRSRHAWKFRAGAAAR